MPIENHSGGASRCGPSAGGSLHMPLNEPNRRQDPKMVGEPIAHLEVEDSMYETSW
jgi:hypothetical protein